MKNVLIVAKCGLKNPKMVVTGECYKSFHILYNEVWYVVCRGKNSFMLGLISNMIRNSNQAGN